jgi:hypothetical protein
MGKYQMDMNGEKKPKIKKLLPEGWRQFDIIGCRQETSKKGNEMFVFTLQDVETKYEDEVYAVSTPGKRWFLKSILASCDCVGASDGVYDWSEEDVLNKRVSGLVEHEPNDWINRDGETVHGKQHKITDIHKNEDQENAWLNEK